MSEYREHNPRELGEYYTRHVMAMTAEELHDKSAIAAELAYRDKCIAELEAENQRLETESQQRKERIALAIAHLEAENQRLQDALERIAKQQVHGNQIWEFAPRVRDIAQQALEKEI